MYSDITQFEPLIPAKNPELEELAYRLVEVSARLEGRLPTATLRGITDLLRIVNSYYSNLIEGHDTHPIDIQRAMMKDYSDDREKRDLQIESLIHISVQEKIFEKLDVEPNTNVADSDFICWIHEEFYRELPENLRWVKGDMGEKAWVEAGEIRQRQVAVGEHLPPVAESLDRFLVRFSEVYSPAKTRGLERIIALAAAHHRLMWIHPFLDGNGRVTRLFTDAFFYRIGFAGYGLWNASRGLARRRADYKKFLAAADAGRDNDYDGRGNLSNRGLTDFCRFFLEICLDQAEYMDSMLKLDDFLRRLEDYVERRNARLIFNEKGKALSSLPSHTVHILKEAAVKGELSRGEIYKIIGMSESSARKTTASLLEEGLLAATSDWHKSPIRLGFPADTASYFFPRLFPDNISG